MLQGATYQGHKKCALCKYESGCGEYPNVSSCYLHIRMFKVK